MKRSLAIVAIAVALLGSGCTSMSVVDRGYYKPEPPRSVERSMQFVDRLNSYRSPNHETGHVLPGGCTGVSTQDGDTWSCDGGTQWKARPVQGGAR